MTPESPIDGIDARLGEFSRLNAYSSIIAKADTYFVKNPWNDDSLLLSLGEEPDADLVDALNHIILPPSFTAVFHTDSGVLEFIFTLLRTDSPLWGREFDFLFDGTQYRCRFAPASPRLLHISRAFAPSAVESSTLYRNLMQFKLYQSDDAQSVFPPGLNPFSEAKPASFLVEKFETWREDDALALAKHLNFGMSYFDPDSPTILIHAQKAMPSLMPLHPVKEDRKFPLRVSLGRKDQFMLDLYMAARDAAPRLRFLYYYQVLEYAAFYFMEHDVRGEMLKVLARPDLHATLDTCVQNVLDITSALRTSDETKLSKVVEACCIPGEVWRVVSSAITSHTQKTVLDGGFVIEPLVSTDTTEGAFASMWQPKLTDTLRKIRNALVHSRESRMDKGILPTRANDILLGPWVEIARCLAEQVILVAPLLA